MRLMFHPRAFRPWIVNWEATAASLIQWLHRDAVSGHGDAETRRCWTSLLTYPDVPRQWRSLDLDASTRPPADRVRARGLRLRYFTTLTSSARRTTSRCRSYASNPFPRRDATEAAARRLAQV